MGFQSAISMIGDGVVKRGPEILFGLSILGYGLTMYACSKATLKAAKEIEIIRNETPEEEHDTKEYYKKVGKKVVPMFIATMALFALSTGGMIASTKITKHRNMTQIAALATAYSASENAFKVYKSKVKEVIGTEKEAIVQQKVDEEVVRVNPPTESNTVYSQGEVRCYDTISGRYFWSDANKIQNAVNVINSRLNNEMYVSLNELYYELGIPAIEMGERLGFNIKDGLLKFNPSARLDDDNKPFLVMRFHIAPRYDFQDNW